MTGFRFRSGPSARRDGSDFERIQAWAHAHVTQLAREIGGADWGRGRDGHLRGPCFLHGGVNPNLDVEDGRGWHCHSKCGGGGDGVDLWRRAFFGTMSEHAGRVAAMRDLASRAGVDLGARRGDTPMRTPPPPVVRTAAPDPVAVEIAAMRDRGVVPTPPAAIYAAVLEALPRTETGDAVLRARGFNPDAAHTCGFRHVDGLEAWDELRATLLASFLPAELMHAGFRTKGDGDRPPALRLAPFGPSVPALLIPYWFRGVLMAVRFRATTTDEPEGGRYRSLTGRGPLVPFNADALDRAHGDVLHVTEGDLNAYAMHLHGVHAVGIPGARNWRREWSEALRPMRRVVAWFDDDEAGRAGLRTLADTLRDTLGAEWLESRALTQPLPPQRDANDLHRAGLLPRYLENIAA